MSGEDRAARAAGRLAGWLSRRGASVLTLSLLLALGGAVAAVRLPVRADLAELLPPDTRSVSDLRALEARVRSSGTVFLLVESADPARRDQAARALAAEVARTGGELVGRVSVDDAPYRRFAWRHRFLYAPLEDLARARDALAERVRGEKLAGNPLYIDLEDDPDAPGGAAEQAGDDADALRADLEELRASADSSEGFVSRDGRLQLVLVRASFSAGNVDRGAILLERIGAAVDRVEVRFPGVRVGVAGDVASSVAEERSILRGMATAAALTIGIVLAGLLFYFRSSAAVLAVLWALAVATLCTFALTRAAIGHLNIATAFLFAIVVGNGINPGLIVMARYREERRRGGLPETAVARALAGSLRGTLAASLTAGVAYGSLMMTDFRGFRHFGFIGGAGMVLAWLSAYTVLPALLLWLERRRPIRFGAPAARPGLLARLAPRRPGRALLLAAALTGLAGAVATRFAAGDPLEEDWRTLRSRSDELREAMDWNRRLSEEFDGSYNQNLSGRFAIAVSDPALAEAVAAQLRALDRGRPAADRLLSDVRTASELLPDQQRAKLQVLAEIRQLLDRDVLPAAGDEERGELEDLRPPDRLAPLGLADLDPDMVWMFSEADGTRGRIVLAASGERFDPWNVRHLVAFADEMRHLGLPPDAVIGGQPFVMADMLRAMERDGPLVSLLALLGSALAVILLVGYGRHGGAVLACALAGTLGMVACVALLGMKINFLDFIALPITIGIGVDYAVNLAARARGEGHAMSQVLGTTGGAVLLCSFTTIVGYGSLLVSENAGIRSFGLAAILGEVTCLLAAFGLLPALLAIRTRRRARSASSARRPAARDPAA